MTTVSTTIAAAAVLVSLLGCSAQEPAQVDESGAPAAAAPPAEPGPAVSGPRKVSAGAAQGTASVVLSGTGVAVSGDYPAVPCGGPYIMGEGVVYQTEADGWKITIATEERNSGDIPLKQSNGDNQVIVTASNGDLHYVRKPSLGGTFRVGEDFKSADADLELGNLMTRDTARLQARFVCD